MADVPSSDPVDPIADLLRRVRGGERPALARAMSIIEHGGNDASRIDALVWRDRRPAHTVGITGAPGAGKSTLTAALVDTLRARSERVAVLAIDPSSPLSGGAVLGDRVRMQRHALDPEVFIRSMANRGHLGGLSRAVPQAVRLFEYAEVPWVVLETVGVGQTEVDVAQAADTTIVVVTPGWGDDVQANKAGLLEVADIFVVNKADREGAHRTRGDLEQMLSLVPAAGWSPPVVSTTASTGEGSDELWDTVLAHRAHLASCGLLEDQREARARSELRMLFVRALEAWAHEQVGQPTFVSLVDRVMEGSLDVTAALDILTQAIDGRPRRDTPPSSPTNSI